MSDFLYLLNAFELASQAETPAEHDYSSKRKAVLDYVAALESQTDLKSALAAATSALIAERDAYYDGITDPEGNILDPEDEPELRRMDRLIDRCRKAVATFSGGSDAPIT